MLQKSRADKILKHMEAVFCSQRNVLTRPLTATNAYAKTPCVILVDDAQNWRQDESFPRFIENLLHKCISQKWPALILITHWQRELAPEVTPQEYSFAGS